MLRELCVLLGLAVGAVAERAILVAHVTGGKLEVEQDIQGRLMAGDDAPVVVIGGIGDHSGLSTLFNVVAAAIGERADAVGFPIEGTERTPGVWALPTTMKTPNGERVILLSCEHCSDDARGIETVQNLFHFVMRASHHLIYHTTTVSEARVAKFELRMRHSRRMEMTQKVPELGSPDDKTITPSELSPITWVWTGEDYSKGSMSDFFNELAQDKTMPKITLAPFPFPVNDSYISSLRSTSLPMNHVTPEFVEYSLNLIRDTSESTRNWPVKVASFYTYLTVLRDVINSNELETTVMDMELITSASMKDRKNYALGLYRDVLGYISKGNKQWIEKVLPSNSATRHSGLLEAVKGGASLVSIVKAVAASTGAEGADQLWANVVAPASQEEFRQGEEKTWDFALMFYSNGFSSTPTSMQVKQELRMEIQQAKEQIKEMHLNNIKAYIGQLFEVVKQGVDRYYEEKDTPEICDPAVLRKMTDELSTDTSLLFGPARGWWPRYDMVNQYEKETKAFIQKEFERRHTKSNMLIHDTVTAIAKEQLAGHTKKCNKQADGKPRMTKELTVACEDAKALVFKNLKDEAMALPQGMCSGDWILGSASYVQTVSSLESEITKNTEAVLDENAAVLKVVMDRRGGDLRDEAREAFAVLEGGECPDEDELDQLARSEVARVTNSLQKGWGTWDAGILDTVVKEVAQGIDDDLMASKKKIEHKLFGSPEVRQWRADWKDGLDTEVEADFMCRLHPYFIRKRLYVSADATAPTEISNQALSSGFRHGLIKKAVNKEMNDVQRSADLELVVYSAIVLVLVSIVVKVLG